jgi:hypothetical protein
MGKQVVRERVKFDDAEADASVVVVERTVAGSLTARSLTALVHVSGSVWLGAYEFSIDHQVRVKLRKAED